MVLKSSPKADPIDLEEFFGVRLISKPHRLLIIKDIFLTRYFDKDFLI
jgi:hypothetical protein